MAYNEILRFLILCIFSLAFFLVGNILGRTQGMREVQVKDYQDGYKEGFETAKRMFYEDPKKEQNKEKELEIERLKKLNNQPPRITAELLMAYGVDSTAHLPNNIKEHYGLKGKPSIDIDTLIEEDNYDRN